MISEKVCLSARRLKFGKDSKEIEGLLFIFFLVYFKVLLHKLNKTLKSFTELPRGLNNSIQNLLMNVEAEENLKIRDSVLNASGYRLLTALVVEFTLHSTQCLGRYSKRTNCVRVVLFL